MESVDTKSENIYSQRVRAGKRTYFFDVKATRSTQDFYIIITESRRVGEDKYEKHKIFLYKEDFQKFVDALTETIDHVENELLVKEAKEQTDGGQNV
jgi:aspartate/glutamate racemase